MDSIINPTLYNNEYIEQLFTLFDNVPESVFVIDISSYEILFVNKTYLEKRRERSSREDSPVGKICYKEIHGFDSPCSFCPNAKLFAQREKAYRWEYYDSDNDRYFLITDRIFKWIDGRDVKFEIAYDITALKRVESLLKQRLKYERGISGFLKELLVSESSVENALRELLHATGVSRVYIYENYISSDSKLHARLKAEVCAEGITPVMAVDEFNDVEYEAISKFVYDRLSTGRIVKAIVRYMPERDRKILGAQDILSVLNIPIFLGAQWYGFIGFDDCRREYQWTEDDVNLLKTAAEMYGLFLENREKVREIVENERRYRVLLESIPDPIIVLDSDTGRVSYVNKVFWRVTGFKEDEVIGKSLGDIGFLECGLSVGEVFYSGGDNGRNLEYKLRMDDGSYRYFIFSESEIQFDGKSHKLIVAKDITVNREIDRSRRKLERELQSVERIKAIGTLAGGIAHDFNNLLMAIGGNVALMLLEKEPSDPDYEKLKSIEGYVKSGSNLTKQLLGYARGGKYEVRVSNINELIERTSEMFGRTKREIKIELDLAGDLWLVKVDVNQLEQVLMNIYINAWQAMPHGGRLLVKTRNVELKRESLKKFVVVPGRYVSVSISDTGIGMDTETMQRVFEPFFTTKRRSGGIGMGMASAYGIVKNHDGYIDVKSKVGEGTTFTIYLPAVEGKVDSKGKTVDLEQVELHRGRGTILIVDDEEIILSINERLLSILGYTVIKANSGKMAVELYKRYSERVDLVILDITMPEMGGRETFFKLKDINSEVKVLISSGYGRDEQITELLESGCKGFLQKPFDLEELSESIRGVLSS